MRRHLNAFTASMALHLAAVVALLSLSAAATDSGRAAAGIAAPRTIVIEWPAAVSADSGSPAAPRAKQDDHDLLLDDDAAELRLANFTFNLAPIAARAQSLFPFVTDTLALEPALATMRREGARTGLVSPLPSAAAAADKPPLVMNDTAMQALVDAAWTRRERWQRFQKIAALMRDHDPNYGDLPLVLRRYIENTVLQPYIDPGSRDPRLWTMLGLAAEHTDFIAFITRYAAEHPSSRTTTELMFLLDDLAQGSRDTLLVLLDTKLGEQTWWTASTNRDAHRLLVGLQRYYRDRLPVADSAQLKDAVHVHYDRVRLAILESIVAATPGGYRGSDARFLIGSIYWKQRQPLEALRWWREMSVAAGDRHVDSYSPLIEAVHAPTAQVSAKEIERILGAHRARSTDFWFARLRKFGYRASTF